jgi:hypothetical protein
VSDGDVYQAEIVNRNGRTYAPGCMKKAIENFNAEKAAGKTFFGELEPPLERQPRGGRDQGGAGRQGGREDQVLRHTLDKAWQLWARRQNPTAAGDPELREARFRANEMWFLYVQAN